MNILCELCGQHTQLGDLHPDAVVVHLECLKKQMWKVREFVQSLNNGKIKKVKNENPE